MDGEQALNYARLRAAAENPSDLARIDRQSQMLRAIQTKLLSPAILPGLPQLVDSLRDSILTDLSPSQMTSLLCIGRLIGNERFESLTLPAAFFTRQMDANDHELLNPDYPAIREFIQQFNQDILPPLAAPP
jgi:anionic cell wall polymer biosynthesis LytR-Cps2A-Psr (LCP) family protein